MPERRGSPHLHRILSRLDPAAAAKIHANDLPKLVRAIEVCLASRTKMTEMWKQGRDPLQGFRIVRLGLDPDRNALYRANQPARRSACSRPVWWKKLELCWRSMARPRVRWPPSATSRRCSCCGAKSTAKTAVQAAQQAHRNYAKRQMTWFRREPDVVWLAGFGDEVSVQNKAISKVAAELEVECVGRAPSPAAFEVGFDRVARIPT